MTKEIAIVTLVVIISILVIAFLIGIIFGLYDAYIERWFKREKKKIELKKIEEESLSKKLRPLFTAKLAPETIEEIKKEMEENGWTLEDYNEESNMGISDDWRVEGYFIDYDKLVGFTTKFSHDEVRFSWWAQVDYKTVEQVRS